MNKERVLQLAQWAANAPTLGLRSYYLGVIEAVTGSDCPFTGHAFMAKHQAALAWLND